MDKEKGIFFGIVGLILVLLIVYIVFAFGGNKDDGTSQEAFDSPAYNIDQKKHQYTSRIDEITKNQYEDPERENPLRYDFIEEEGNKEDELQEQPKEKKPTINIQKRTNRSSETPKKKELEVIEEEPVVSRRYGFSSSSAESKTPGSSPTQQYNLWAQLDEKTVISENSNQVFLLENSARIGGRVFPANSKLYTNAIVKADYIDILVQRIKDINTHEEFSVNMYAVNEDRARGIKYQGKANKESDKASKNVLSEASRSIYRRYNVDNVAEAAGDGIEEIVGRDQIEVPIGKGYRLIFIENN